MKPTKKRIDEVSDGNDLESVETAISSMKKQIFKCCDQQCLKYLLEKNDTSLRVFLEEWLQLKKKPKEAVLRVTYRLCSHWSANTVRGFDRFLARFEFEDPIRRFCVSQSLCNYSRHWRRNLGTTYHSSALLLRTFCTFGA